MSACPCSGWFSQLALDHPGDVAEGEGMTPTGSAFGPPLFVHMSGNPFSKPPFEFVVLLHFTIDAMHGPGRYSVIFQRVTHSELRNAAPKVS